MGTDDIGLGLEMDIRDLKFDNESFDAVIDKGRLGMMMM